jgi:hypothetical protein
MGTVRDGPGLWLAEPVAELLPDPDPGSERGDPVVRGPVADRVRSRGPTLPDAIEHAIAECECRAERGSHADSDSDSRPDAGADTGTHARADAGAATALGSDASRGIGPGRTGGFQRPRSLARWGAASRTRHTRVAR